MKWHRLSMTAAISLVLFTATECSAQEPTYMDAATHPGKGQFYSRLLISSARYSEAGNDIDEQSAVLKTAWGILPTLAVLAEGEFASYTSSGKDDTGLRMATVQLKYRLFKKDLGPLNTWRTSILGGVSIPGDIEDSAPDRVYPRASIVSTAILGRHGLNGEAEWQEYGESADRFSANASHLYRLSPSEYTAATAGAWYTMLESLNDFNEDGDSRSDAAFGILYEARRWAWEISLRLPIAQNWDQENKYIATTGFRLLF